MKDKSLVCHFISENALQISISKACRVSAVLIELFKRSIAVQQTTLLSVHHITTGIENVKTELDDCDNCVIRMV